MSQSPEIIVVLCKMFRNKIFTICDFAADFIRLQLTTVFVILDARRQPIATLPFLVTRSRRTVLVEN